MLLRHYLQTANFINKNMHRPFAWGEWDCNLCMIDLLDILYPVEVPRSASIRGKYNSRKTAIRFQKNYISAPELFEQAGLELMEVDSSDFKNMDIIFRPTGSYWTMSAQFAGRTWGVVEDAGMMVNIVEPGQYLIARNNG